jgi:arylsulfatase A-like enzyme
MALRPIAIAVLLALLAGCGSDGSRTPAEVDLTALATGVLNGRREYLSVTRGDDLTGLLLPGSATLDLFVRPPADGRLSIVLSSAGDAEPVSVSVEDTRHEEAALAWRRGTGDEWDGALPETGGEPVRVRLTNQRRTPQAWFRPRIRGVTRLHPGPLDGMRPPPGHWVNVVLYVIDTLRADRLSAYGYERDTSPQLKARAEKGVLFRNAYATASHTVPSIASLYWSRMPSDLTRGGGLPSAPSPTLAERFQAGGYATAAFQGNELLVPGSGYSRGFDTYEVLKDARPEKKGVPIDAGNLHSHVLSWMVAHRDEPFFVYVQTMDVHYPYLPPAPFTDMFVDPAKIESVRREMEEKGVPPDKVKKALWALESFNPHRYDGGIAYADHELGRFLDALDALGLGERTAVVITADHGEPLGQHGDLLHGRSLHEEIIHVPLVVLLPWHRQGVQVDEIVSLIDVAPTLLDLAGLPVPAEFRGRSLFAPWNERRPPAALGEQTEMRSQRTAGAYMREGSWKLMVDGDNEALFQVPPDVGETKDVKADHPIETGYLRTEMMRRVPAFERDAPPAQSLESGLSAPQRKKLEESLRALGYIE